MTPAHRLQTIHRRLKLAELLVPRSRRVTWRQEWIAELSYLSRENPLQSMASSEGLMRDAVTLRWLDWRDRCQAVDRRSPEFCLRTLSCLFLLLLLTATGQPQLRHLLFSIWGVATFAIFFILSILTVPSTVVVSRFGACDAYVGEVASLRRRMARWCFLGAKLALLVVSFYLLAVLVTWPLHHWVGHQADFVFILCALPFNVVAIGWAFNDQRQRCPTCMRALRSPARMGPPSWSLLDSNATEEMCDRGHGLLHQPEWQTSWFENARWLQLDRTWRELFHP